MKCWSVEKFKAFEGNEIFMITADNYDKKDYKKSGNTNETMGHFHNEA